MRIPDSSVPDGDCRRAFLSLPDLLAVFGFNGRFTLVNPAWSIVLGMHPDDIRDRFYLEFVHPDDQNQSGRAFRRLAAGEQSVVWQNRFRNENGGYRRLQWHASSDVIRREIYAVARDVGELNVDVDLLQDSEFRSISTIENTVEGILRVTPSGQITMANPAAVRLLGYAREEELIERGAQFLRELYVDIEDRDVLQEHLGREGMVDLECALYRKDRSILWVALKARSVRHVNGALAYIEKYLKDITPQRQLEEAMRAEESKYRSLVENAPFGIYRIGLNGQFLDVNHALVAMLGYESRDEVMKLNIEADVYIDPAPRARFIKQFGDVERIDALAAEWKRKDGSPILVRLSARKIRDASGMLEGFEVIAQDTNR